jgi:hypothetical protein
VIGCNGGGGDGGGSGSGSGEWTQLGGQVSLDDDNESQDPTMLVCRHDAGSGVPACEFSGQPEPVERLFLGSQRDGPDRGRDQLLDLRDPRILLGRLNHIHGLFTRGRRWKLRRRFLRPGVPVPLDRGHPLERYEQRSQGEHPLYRLTSQRERVGAGGGLRPFGESHGGLGGV